MKKMGLVLALVMVTTILAQAAVARPRDKKIEGSFTAEAKPKPTGWPVSDEGCMVDDLGLHRVSEQLNAPFSGWLTVSAKFVGNWDLALFEDDVAVAWSHHQENTDEQSETLHYFVREDQDIDIAVCNGGSPSSAEVHYILQSGKPWALPVGRQLETHAEELDYQSPALTTNDRVIYCHSGYELGCSGTSSISPRDRYVYMEVDDYLDDVTGHPGQQVYVEVYQYTGFTYLGHERFCTRTDEPIALKPGVDFLGVAVFVGDCGNGEPAFGTTGTVTAVFSNQKA